MTPKEFQAELAAIVKEVGPSADVYAMISTGGSKPIHVSLYPTGMGVDRRAFMLQVETFEEALTATRAKWAEQKEEHERQLVRRMALRIIEITALTGECTDAALRGDKFSTEEVARYGERACADANDIAGRGPFAIVKLGQSNGAPAEAEAVS